MTTYEFLDHIADSVNPTLGLLALAAPWLPKHRNLQPSPLARMAGAVLCVGIAHLGHIFDRFTGLWPAFGLDYSGHSAVCVALLVSLGHLGRRWRAASVCIGIGYAALMMYQGYHTLADIVTTATPIGLASMLVWHCMYLLTKRDVQYQ
jgi:hypothetical protein